MASAPWLLAGLAALLLLSQPAAALCTFYTDPKFPTVKPVVLRAVVRVELLDGYAIVEIEKTFRNPDPRIAQVGDILFPLPSEHAFITALSLGLGDAWHNASVVEREQGRENFSRAVEESRDATLLEYLGGNQYALRVTLPPLEDRTLRVRYEEPLARAGGMFHFRYPLTEEALSDPGRFVLELEARTAGAFGAFRVLSPRGLEPERPDERTAMLRLEARGAAELREDLVLAWATREEEEARLFVERGPDGGHFVFRLLPGEATLARARPRPVDVLVLVDASGSMAKEGRFGAAARAAREVLAALGPGDRFDVATFASRPEPWAGALVPASEARMERALAWLEGQRPEGSTNLGRAVRDGLEELASGREGAQPVLVLVSDGEPTAGARDGTALLHLAGAANLATHQDAIVAALQAGEAVRQAQKFDPWARRIEGAEPLLEVLARENHGVGLPLARARDLRDLLEGPGRVLLRNVSVAVEGLQAKGIAPGRVPLLVAGGEVLVAGRYEGEGPLAVVLRGGGADGPVELRWELDTREAAEHPLAERVGAMVRLRGLLQDIRVLGPAEERVAQAKVIAAQHGYVTPYTSLLVDLPAAEAFREERATSASAPAPAAPLMPGGRRVAAQDGALWEQAPRLEEHPLVRDREVDRYVLAGSPEHKERMARGHGVLAWGGGGAAIVEQDGEVVLFADQATLDAIAWSQGRFATPGPGAALLFLAAGLAIALLRRARRGSAK